MKAFIIHRSKGSTAIVEVEYEKVSLMEDPSLESKLLNGEFACKITAPSLVVAKGEKLVYMSWAVYPTLEKAQAKLEIELKEEAERTARKSGTTVDYIALLEKVKQVPAITL